MMNLTYEQDYFARMDWRETLAVGFDIEWLFDKAERGEWSGLWW